MATRPGQAISPGDVLRSHEICYIHKNRSRCVIKAVTNQSVHLTITSFSPFQPVYLHLTCIIFSFPSSCVPPWRFANFESGSGQRCSIERATKAAKAAPRICSCTLYSVQCTVYSMQCTLYAVCVCSMCMHYSLLPPSRFISENDKARPVAHCLELREENWPNLAG